MIKIMESDRLFNTRNIILYSLTYVLASSIEESCNKAIGGITTSYITQLFCKQCWAILQWKSCIWALMLTSTDKKIDSRPSSLFVLAFTPIVFSVNSSQLQSLVALVYLGLQACNSNRVLTKSLGLMQKKESLNFSETLSAPHSQGCLNFFVSCSG